jgi:hypothetical protein
MQQPMWAQVHPLGAKFREFSIPSSGHEHAVTAATQMAGRLGTDARASIALKRGLVTELHPL